MNTYRDFLKFLNEKAQFGIKLGLDTIETFLKNIGNPHKAISFIHIAGSNGKGSVASMITSILGSAGKKVGLYTSPHLLSERERIKINNICISEEDLLSIAKEIVSYAPPTITYFEFLTVAAIKYFYDKKVDVAVMEVGMGGRLDATNVIDSILSVITGISLEHTKYLGESLDKIAAEKAAIIKENSIVISGVSEKKASLVIQNASREKNAKLLQINNEVSYNVKNRSIDGQVISVKTTKKVYDDIRLSLLGDHQAKNCALAVCAIEVLIDSGWAIPVKSIYEGLLDVAWQGRFQIVSRHPMVVVDGAHNPQSAEALRETIKQYLPEKKITLILGVLEDKDYKKIVEVLEPIAERIITVTPKSNRAFPGEKLKKIIKNNSTECIEDVKEALNIATRDAEVDTVVVITGSLYLIGEVLNENINL